MHCINTKKKKGKISNRGSAGFTIAELLVATLILMLATSLITESMAVAFRQFFQRTQRSEAELLLASLQTAIQEELTYATNIEPKAGGAVTSFTSYRAGANSTLESIDGKVYLNGDVLKKNGVTGNGFGLVSTGSYDMESGVTWGGNDKLSLWADLETLSYSTSDGAFTVKLVVCSSKNGAKGDTLTQSTFYVYPVDP